MKMCRRPWRASALIAVRTTSPAEAFNAGGASFAAASDAADSTSCDATSIAPASSSPGSGGSASLASGG